MGFIIHVLFVCELLHAKEFSAFSFSLYSFGVSKFFPRRIFCLNCRLFGECVEDGIPCVVSCHNLYGTYIN